VCKNAFYHGQQQEKSACPDIVECEEEIQVVCMFQNSSTIQRERKLLCDKPLLPLIIFPPGATANL